MTGSNRRPTPCKGAALPTELITPPETTNQFKASFNALPGRNLGTLAALILIAAPVRGLRPARAARLVTAKEPNPTKETVPPFFKVVFTAPMMDSNARDEAALEMSACLAMCSINSVLFTKISLSIRILGEVAEKILKFNYATFRSLILSELNYE